MKPDNSSKKTQTTSEAPPHKRTPTLPLCQLRGSDLKAIFLASNRQITVDGKRKENTLNMLREEILTQKNRPLQSRGKLLLCYLGDRFIGRNSYIGRGDEFLQDWKKEIAGRKRRR